MTAKRVHRFMAGASSHISKEMIELSFLECFQIMMFFRNQFLCFLLPFFFFFQSAVQNRGEYYSRVRIIHG